jgi:hypothetical protein
MDFLMDLVLALAQQMALGLALVTVLRLALHLAEGLVLAKVRHRADQ